MGAVHLSVDIERPIYQVFDYVTDLRHEPQWFRGILGVRLVSRIQRGTGTTYEQDSRIFGWRFLARLTVADYDPPKYMVLRTESSALPFLAEYHFEPVGGRPWPVTRFTLDADVHGTSIYRVLGPALTPMLRLAVKRRLHRLKLLLESGGTG